MPQPQATSDRPIVSARPRFTVDGKEIPTMTDDLVWLEVHQSDDGITSLEARFTNWDGGKAGAPPDFTYFDGRLDFGSELQIHAGDEDNEAQIFTGLLTAIEGAFLDRMPPELVLRGEDRLQELRMNSRTDLREQMSDADIVGEVGSAYGMSVDDDTNTSPQRAHWQINRSDLAVIQERARAADARIGIDGDQLVLARRQEPAGEAVELTWFDELLEFQVAADLAHQRRRVRVHGYSPDDKRGVHGSAGPGEVDRATQNGRSGPQILEQLGIEADEHVHAENPETDGEASQIARSLQMARARRFVQGHGITAGTPGLRVADVVDLKGLGPLFSGKYAVVDVRHTFDRTSGLRTRFEARRTTVGGPS